MSFFGDITRAMEQWGIFDVVLPFFLVFTIVFAFLEKTKILGSSAQVKRFNMIIAVVMGLLSVRVPIYVTIINDALPKIAIMIVALLMYFLLVSMFSGEGYEKQFSGYLKGILIVLALFVGWAFLANVTGLGIPAIITDNLAVIISLLAFAAVIGFIVADRSNTSSSAPKKKEGTQQGE